MNICVVGTGCVGLVTAACLAELGHSVRAVDQDRERIQTLSSGGIPIYEPGLLDLVSRNAAQGRLSFWAELSQGLAEASLAFITVGTPARLDGWADVTQVESAAEGIASSLRDYTIVAIKSTVPIGTGQRLREIIQAKLTVPVEFDVVSNPEFLREGTAVSDFMHPDRIVVGTTSERARRAMAEVYRAFDATPFVWTDSETAELIKYAANAFLAVKVSFINEIASLCEKVGTDVRQVACGIGLDRRIGTEFLRAGPGYGGPCLTKDTVALSSFARTQEVCLSLVEAAIVANNGQRAKAAEKILAALGNPLGDKVLAILGISFKPNTDDIRDSPAVSVVEKLAAMGLEIRVCDPVALARGRAYLGDQVTYCEDAYTAATGADAVILITDWDRFRGLDLHRIRQLMRGDVFVDLRNCYESAWAAEAGLRYVCIGRGR